jgi:hypothetical protein
MNKVFQFLLLFSLLLLTFFGFLSLQTRINLRNKEENTLSLSKREKKSYGEGEYYKALLLWKNTDEGFFNKIMSASVSTNEIILLRQYKYLMEEIAKHVQELNLIDPPVAQKLTHEKLIILNEYAYQTCLFYFKDVKKSQFYFKKYVLTYYRLYRP